MNELIVKMDDNRTPHGYFYVEDVGYVSAETQVIPGKESYSAVEFLIYCQENNIKMLDSKQWFKVFRTAHDNYPSLAEKMGFELVKGILAWPVSGGWYSSRIKPRPEKGENPLLLESFVIKGDAKNYSIENPEITELKYFPRKGRYVDLSNEPEYINQREGPSTDWNSLGEKVAKEIREVFGDDLFWSPGGRMQIDRRATDQGLRAIFIDGGYASVSGIKTHVCLSKDYEVRPPATRSFFEEPPLEAEIVDEKESKEFLKNLKR